MPGRMPEDMPDRMPEDMPDRMPDRIPEDMSDRMPEDLPVTKCINVMVGITRSKVIVFSCPRRPRSKHHGRQNAEGYETDTDWNSQITEITDSGWSKSHYTPLRIPIIVAPGGWQTWRSQVPSDKQTATFGAGKGLLSARRRWPWYKARRKSQSRGSPALVNSGWPAGFYVLWGLRCIRCGSSFVITHHYAMAGSKLENANNQWRLVRRSSKSSRIMPYRGTHWSILKHLQCWYPTDL